MEKLKRKKAIRNKLEQKLKEAEMERREQMEREKHGIQRVREVETIEGKKRIVSRNRFFIESSLQPKKWAKKPFKASEFFIALNPMDLELLERSREIKITRLTEKLRKTIEKEKGTQFTEQKIKILQGELKELMEAYNINQREIEKKIEKKEIASLRAEIAGLMDLIELERKLRTELFHKPTEEELHTPNFEHQKERIIDLAIQVKLHKIILDTAIVFAFIETRKKTNLKEIKNALEMKKESAKACTELLKAEGFIQQQTVEDKQFLKTTK